MKPSSLWLLLGRWNYECSQLVVEVNGQRTLYSGKLDCIPYLNTCLNQFSSWEHELWGLFTSIFVYGKHIQHSRGLPNTNPGAIVGAKLHSWWNRMVQSFSDCVKIMHSTWLMCKNSLLPIEQAGDKQKQPAKLWLFLWFQISFEIGIMSVWYCLVGLRIYNSVSNITLLY